MVRPRWASPEQYDFLQSFLLNLDQEKKGHGLTTHYDRVANRFLEKWPASPNDKDQEAAGEKGDPQQFAVARRIKVSPY